MRSLYHGLILFVTMGVALIASPDRAFAAEASIKSYREWKFSKIQEAESRVDSVRARLGKTDPNLAKTKGVEGRDNGDTHKLENQLQNEKVALDMAKELTVSDYFAGYLTKQADKKSAFKEVAGKLSAEEVAELMTAYANSVFGGKTGNLSPSAQNLGPENLK